MSKQTAKFIARIAENFPEMPPDVMQAWIENPRGLQKFLSGLVPDVANLDFFQIRSGLYVDESFRRLVVAKAKPSELVDAHHFDLPSGMTDAEIEKKLREDFGSHIWDESVLCATLQKWITDQEGGKSGKLLNNGYANIFYTSSCVVYVSWDADGRRWGVLTWKRDAGGWSSGNRAFSPAT